MTHIPKLKGVLVVAELVMFAIILTLIARIIDDHNKTP